MKTKGLYDLAVKLGIESDLRGEAAVMKRLERIKARYEKLDDESKEDFETESLSNPYSDSRILNDSGREIKKILVGVDVEGPELLLAKQLGADLAIAHHPEGIALAGLHSVMEMQSEILALYGITINIAESVIRPRISEVNRSLSPANHNRSVDMAKLLGLDFMCIHTPADNLGTRFMADAIEKAADSLEYVEDLLKLVKGIPEFKEAAKYKMGPMLFAGSPESHCGKIVVTEFTGGTSGSKDIYEKMSHYGIGTIIGMHMGEEHRKEAEKYHINVLVAGHMAADSLGLNLLLDEYEKQGAEIIPTSGLIRVKR